MTVRYSEEEYEKIMQRRLCGSEPQAYSNPSPLPISKPKPSRKMTKTEEEAGNMLRMEFAGCKVVFHGLAFYLDAGHRYTADWCVHLPDSKILVVEVKQEGKNGFVQQSQRDAKVRFDQTAHEWPMMAFRWMTKTKDGWQIKDLEGR